MACTATPGSASPIKAGTQRASDLLNEAGDVHVFQIRDCAALALALGQFRQGDYEACSQTVNRIDLTNVGDQFQPMTVWTNLVLAMSEFQTGNHEAAQASLAKARQLTGIYDAMLPGTPDSPSANLWPLWMYYKALLQAAEVLIGATLDSSD